MNNQLLRSIVLLFTIVMLSSLSLNARDIKVNSQSETKLELLQNTYNFFKSKK